MTREQVRAIFQELRSRDPEIATRVTLDDSNPEFLYFLAGTCPHLRYRFENNRLVAAGRLGMEVGFWDYFGRNFTEARCDRSRTESGEYHWFRTSPRYDQHGHFIGLEKIDDGPLSPGSLKEYLQARRDVRRMLRQPTEKEEEKADDLPPGERNYCKGMKAPGP